MSTRIATMIVFGAITSIVAADGLAQTRTRVQSDRNQGWLGVVVDDVTARLKERKKLTVDAGAYVQEVLKDSPAEKAGISEGDVIVLFDGKRIDDGGDLTKAVRRTKPKTDVQIEVVRKDGRKKLSATIGRDRGAFAYSFGFSHPKIATPRPPRAFREFRLLSGRELSGMHVQDVGKQLAEFLDVPGRRGVLVTEVEEGSGAAESGVKAGDVIVKANANTVRDVGDLREEFMDADAGAVSLEVIRKGKPVTLAVPVEDDSDDDFDGASLNFILPPESCNEYDGSFAIPSEKRRNLIDELRLHIEDLKLRVEEKFNQFRRSVRETFVST